MSYPIIERFITNIVLIASVQAIFLAFVLLGAPSNRLSNRLLSFLLLIISSMLTVEFLKITERIHPERFTIIYLIPTLFLYGPLIFMYTKSMSFSLPKLTRKEFIHIVPAAVAIPAVMVDHIYWTLRGYDLPYSPVLAAVCFAGLASVLIYTAFSLYHLRLYRRRVINFYSDLHRVNLRWLTWLLSLLMFVFLSLFAVFISRRLGMSRTMIPVPRLVINFSALIALFTTAFYSIRQPEVFLLERNDVDNEKKKYSRTALSKEKLDEYNVRLSRFMNEERPFLEESLTLQDLSDETDIPLHHLSMVINGSYNKNFFQFINGYRLDHFKDLISLTENRERSILDLALESGFNSKTTFNTIFKKTTGMTPSQYRNSL